MNNTILSMKYQEVRNTDFVNTANKLSEDEIRYIITSWGGYWKHSGNPEEPHPLLTSGGDGGEFFDLSFVAQFPIPVAILAKQMAFKLIGSVKESDWVVGPSYGANPFVYRLGAALGCKHAVTEKMPDNSQSWTRFLIRDSERVLMTEDVTTTGASVLKTKAGIIAGNAGTVEFFPLIAAFVNRSGKEEIDGHRIIALLRVDKPKQWKPEECELCRLGSKVIPKFKSYLASQSLPVN